MSVRQRKERERTARRQAILAAAAKIFSSHGLEDATIEMVAREAEVAVGTIYLYFCSRDHLYLSLVEERVDRLRQTYLAIHAKKLGPLEEFKAITDAYIAYLGESRGLFLTQLSVALSDLGRSLRRKAEIDTFRNVMGLARSIFEIYESSVRRIYDAGLIRRDLDRTRTAAVVWGALNGAFLLTGDEALFKEMTGVSAQGLCEHALKFLLAGAETSKEKKRVRRVSAHLEPEAAPAPLQAFRG